MKAVFLVLPQRKVSLLNANTRMRHAVFTLLFYVIFHIRNSQGDIYDKLNVP